jgi:glycosyltransferase involved in cell wall biosynthesis
VPPLTLLQIVPSLSGGGLARATLDTAQAVVAAGGSAIVASPAGTMVPDLLRLRATHIALPEWGSALWSRLSLPPKLFSSLRLSKVSLVQSRSPLSAIVASALARRLKVPWISTLHRPLLANGFGGRRMERRQLRADAVVAVSEHVAATARAQDVDLGDRLQVIPTGVNFERFDPASVRVDRVIRLASELRVPDGSSVVLCPGRFDQDRGQKLLIDAIKRLGRNDVFCLLLGSTGMPTAFERELEQTIERAKLHGRVQIGPYVDDMPAAYRLADVVVATGGATQGISRPLIEAQAMGRPVVAESAGGAAESVLVGTTGWLATPGDPASLAEALTSALSLSLDRRSELAQVARDHARARYDLADANSRLLQLYGRILG